MGPKASGWRESSAPSCSSCPSPSITPSAAASCAGGSGCPFAEAPDLPVPGLSAVPGLFVAAGAGLLASAVPGLSVVEVPGLWLMALPVRGSMLLPANGMPSEMKEGISGSWSGREVSAHVMGLLMPMKTFSFPVAFWLAMVMAAFRAAASQPSRSRTTTSAESSSSITEPSCIVSSVSTVSPSHVGFCAWAPTVPTSSWPAPANAAPTAPPT
mmetsp:Transcript_5084/g.13156  ORF Transcript_5084/g.13156 Transcript_5084/m.13156 type:complete len:213 (-) Transcript_5084:18-656(-)